MKYTAIIFDLDGTIINSEDIWTRAVFQVLFSYGITLGIEDKHNFQKLSGTTLDYALNVLIEHFNLNQPYSQVLQDILTVEQSLSKTNLSFIYGFESFMDLITAKGYRKAVATNAHDQAIARVTTQMQLDQFFGSHIYGISCVKNVGKPDPAIYHYAAQQLSVEPLHCIAIEDSQTGIQAAKSAGMYCIGINSGGDKDQLRESNQIVNSYNEIQLDI